MRIVFDSRDHKVRIGFDAVFKRNGDINESTGHSRTPGAKSLANFTKGFRNPIRDVDTSSGHVIRADVLDTTLGCIKYLQLALRTQTFPRALAFVRCPRGNCVAWAPTRSSHR